MKTKAFQLIQLSLIILAFLVSGCEIIPFVPKPPGLGKYDPNQKEFDMDLFEANLISNLGNQWVGYAYVINQNGQLAKDGLFGDWKQGREKKPADLSSPVYLASVDKTIGTTALIIAMREYGHGLQGMLNSPIGPYLPEVLNASPQVRNLRFIDLLTHRSGFPQTVNATLANMKVMAGSANVARNSPFAYSNVNFFFIKYLIFHMAGQNLNGLLTEDQQQAKIKQFYAQFANSRIFIPSGINTATSISSAVLGYRFGDDSSVPGWFIDDVSDMLGSGGLYMSALDIAKFQAFLNNSQTLLTTQERASMYLNYLGWGDINPFTNPIVGTQGTYYSKQGSYINNQGQGVRTLIMTFPKNKVEVVFLANSRGGNLDNTAGLNTIIRNAYDAAWQ